MTNPAATVLAVDVGGTSIKASVLDDAGQPLRTDVRRTPADEGPDAVVAAVRRTALDLTDDAVVAAAVVVPGSVDVATGTAKYSVNIGWHDVPLRELVSRDLGVPVAFGHDVGAAGLAERTLGAAFGVADSLVLVIGTGVAGVAVSGGALVHGATGLAGEIGHIPVHPGGEPCACGQLGCLETYASAGALVRRYAARSGRELDGADELLAIRDTDELAGAVWSEAVDALAIALTTYTMLFDPEVVVLGGGLAEAGSCLLDGVREGVASRLVWRSPPQIVLSPLGRRAGQLGAGLQAWQLAGSDGFANWPEPA
jgi:glucokinase